MNLFGDFIVINIIVNNFFDDSAVFDCCYMVISFFVDCLWLDEVEEMLFGYHFYLGEIGWLADDGFELYGLVGFEAFLVDRLFERGADLKYISESFEDDSFGHMFFG